MAACESLCSTALCAPACRTVALQVWLDPSHPEAEAEHVVYPVLAIYPERDVEGEWDREFPTFEAVIVVDGYLGSFRSLTRSAAPGELVSSLLIACPWPPEEDKKQLALWIGCEVAALREKLDRTREKELRAARDAKNGGDHGQQ